MQNNSYVQSFCFGIHRPPALSYDNLTVDDSDHFDYFDSVK